jgi:hypothetical protein
VRPEQQPPPLEFSVDVGDALFDLGPCDRYAQIA